MPSAATQNFTDAGRDPAELLDTLHCLRIAITIFDSAGRLVYANAHLNYLFRDLPPFESLLGCSYEQILRLNLPAIAPTALADGGDSFVATLLTQLQPNAWAPRDIALADGRLVEIKARHDTRGNTILLWSDVTQARQQFARLEEAITLSADAFAFFDRDDRLVAANALYAQLAAVPMDALKGWSFEDIIRHVARQGRVALDIPPDEWVARRLRSHRAPSSTDVIQTAHGDAYLVRDRATPDGGRAVVFTDITEKTRAENALAQAQSALENTRDQARAQMGFLADLTRKLDTASAQADNAKTMLLRTMSHELKTPLNAILGFSDLMGALADNLKPEQVREYAGLIHLGGTNLLKMLNQIMDLTKISAGRYDLRRSAVDAGSMLWLAREAVAAKAAAKQITIDADACPIGLMADADETVLGGMLANLLDNAVTFTQAGGHIRLAVAAAPDGVKIEVRDNGPGVAAEDIKRILHPFEHAGRVADHANGAGLGLTLVKAFAELHGGKLELESVAGDGFCALVTLPSPYGLKQP